MEISWVKGNSGDRAALVSNNGLLQARPWFKDAFVSLGAIVLIAMIIALFAALPTWPYSRDWGYGPAVLVGRLLFMAALFVELAGV